MIKKILVPVDGSEHAERALDSALDLAQKYSAEVLILTVVQYGPLPSEGSPQSINAYLEAIDDFHRKVLSDALEKVKKTIPGLKVSTKSDEGYPADKIIETANEDEFDLIVMGRRGRGHLRHTLLGSVSDRVADLSPCALFLIK
ncbi:MAG: hypothetical protein QG670_248 [Thermoproteota archaeon]|nr:hypothetical protein [Thermoproteota archaeon]